VLRVTPDGFRYMTYSLAKLTPTVIAVEDGYNVDAVADSMLVCAETLLAWSTDKQPVKFTATSAPNPQVVKDVKSTRDYLMSHWDCLTQKQ